jgi:putative RecB family exonuclease
MADPSEDLVHRGTVVDGTDVLGALSPSRASDFKSCALRYRLRSIDRLPEDPSPAALRGILVHQVLDELFDLPAPQRTPERAAAMVTPTWDVFAADPSVASMFADTVALGAWLESCRVVIARYFELEDPRALEPFEREVYVETLLGSRLLLRGVIDRVDMAEDGSLRIVDYKSSRAPASGFESGPLFQLRFYALVLWRSRGVLPSLLRLLYLGDGTSVSYVPDEDDLRATERQVETVWEAVALAHETGEWLPQPGGGCQWCSFQAHCPAFGGTPPPLPVSVVASEPDDGAADLTGGRTTRAEHQGVGP